MKTNVKKPVWKRIVLISSIVILVAAPAIYAWTSVQAWNTASAATTDASSDLKKSVDTTLATETAPESTQAAIDEIVKNYNDALKKGPCELPALYEWQSNLPWLKDDRQKCLDMAKSSDELATSLKTLQALLKEEAAAAQLVKQATDSTAAATDYTASAATWQKVASDPSLTTNDAFKPVGAKVIDVSAGIALAYTALAKANTDEDKAAFDTAKKNLADAYARLPEIKTVSTEALNGQVDAVVKAYDSL